MSSLLNWKSDGGHSPPFPGPWTTHQPLCVCVCVLYSSISLTEPPKHLILKNEVTIVYEFRFQHELSYRCTVMNFHSLSVTSLFPSVSWRHELWSLRPSVCVGLKMDPPLRTHTHTHRLPSTTTYTAGFDESHTPGPSSKFPPSSEEHRPWH